MRAAEPAHALTQGPDETAAIAARLAMSLRPGDVVLVTGDVGAGKTTFVRGACRALGVTEPITSPTFTIGRLYDSGRVPVSHLDLFRLAGLDAEDPALLDDYVTDDGVAFVEWPEVAVPELARGRIVARSTSSTPGATAAASRWRGERRRSSRSTPPRRRPSSASPARLPAGRAAPRPEGRAPAARRAPAPAGRGRPAPGGHRLGGRRADRRRRGPRIVHRPADRHRDGAGPRPGQWGRAGRRIDAAGARDRGRRADRPGPGGSEAQGGSGDAEPHCVLAVLDARRGEAFAAAWRGTECVLAPAALGPEALAAVAADARSRGGRPWLAVGDGAVRFRAQLESAAVSVPADSPPCIASVPCSSAAWPPPRRQSTTGPWSRSTCARLTPCRA